MTYAGGEAGIRTLGTHKGTTVFETAPIDRSGTSPTERWQGLSRVGQGTKAEFGTQLAPEGLLRFSAHRSRDSEGRGRVCAPEPVSVDAERDRGGSVSEPPADSDDVDSSRDQG